MIGNELYYIDFISGNGSRLLKVDITIPNATPVIVENTLAFGNDIFAVGTDIYTVHGGTAKRVTKTDTTVSLPTFEESVLTGIDRNSEFIFISGTDVYISTFQDIGGRIQRYTLNTLSVPDNTKTIDVNVYPNPARTNITVTLGKDKHIDEISVYNALGIQVKEIHIHNTSKATVDLSNLSKGVYFLKIKSENKIFTKKIIKE
jgi:hypothetical protein